MTRGEQQDVTAEDASRSRWTTSVHAGAVERGLGLAFMLVL
jgi:hypothetical protein